MKKYIFITLFFNWVCFFNCKNSPDFKNITLLAQKFENITILKIREDSYIVFKQKIGDTTKQSYLFDSETALLLEMPDSIQVSFEVSQWFQKSIKLMNDFNIEGISSESSNLGISLELYMKSGEILYYVPKIEKVTNVEWIKFIKSLDKIDKVLYIKK